MTRLLARAFEQASKLPVERQDELAAALLENLVGWSPPNVTSTLRRQGSDEIALRHLVQRGWLTAPAAPSQNPPPRAAVASFRELMQELDLDRGER